jgi:hypothetical protein
VGPSDGVCLLQFVFVRARQSIHLLRPGHLTKQCQPSTPHLAVERFEPVMLVFAGILLLSSFKLLL